MRILSVSPYHEPEGGGLERYAHAMDAALAARGHAVRALAFSAQPDRVVPGWDRGVELETHRPALRLGNTPIHPRFAGAVARAIRSHKPDVLVAHTPVPFPAEMAFRAARRANVPFVTVYHAGELRGSSRLLDAMAAVDRATLQRAMLAGSARLVAVSAYVRDHALSAHAARTTIVPPGVDLARWPVPARGAGDGFLFVAPLDTRYRWKGLDTLLAAFARVHQQRPEARLDLVGAGDRVQELQEHPLARSGALRLLGRLSDADLAAAYRTHAATVLPSITDAESFGMVLAEANAAGRPVIGSAIGGIPCFVTHGRNGLLARPGDPADLATQMLRILADPGEARRMGEAGRDLVAREHAWPRLAERFEQVLVDATGRLEPPLAA